MSTLANTIDNRSINQAISNTIDRQNTLAEEVGLHKDKFLYDHEGNPRWLEFVRNDYNKRRRRVPKDHKRTSVKIDYLINRLQGRMKGVKSSLK